MTTHLYIRSSYSLLDSTIRIRDLVAKAVEYGYSSVALTDHNVMFGIPSFQHACEEAGIHPIYGLEADCHYHETRVPFLLLAKDNLGYQNLMRLSSEICSTKDTMCTVEQLIQGSQNCVLIAYGMDGWLDHDLICDQWDEVREKLTIMKRELPPFDISLSYMESAVMKPKNLRLKNLCESLSISCVALNKIVYLNESDRKAYQVLCGIRKNQNILDKSLTEQIGRSFLTKEEMASRFEEAECRRTDELAAQCTADLKIPKTSLPAFHTPSVLNSAQYLTQLCLAGLKKRLKNPQKEQEYQKRLKYELDIILKMHFEDYFLIVYDFIRYARSQSIYIGPGRGSAAGSLVAYCLGITSVDPIHYHLLFERFLNPERISMPDIDTDIPDNRRQEVIDYVVRTYGPEHTASIVTFGTLGAKQVIHDVGKVLNLNSRDIDMLAKMIPNTPKITLKQAFAQNAKLKQIVEAEDRYLRLFQIAFQLEGLPRTVSKHAGGVIMSSLPLTSIVPVERMDLDGIAVSQYSMEYLEERGLIKMDFLGLRNLSIIDEIVKKIQEENPAFRIQNIPLEDPRTYEVFRRADTIGVFQFESAGMKNLLRKMKPERFEDVVAALALFRPASAESIPLYLANRQNPSQIAYPTPALLPVLKETYGVMIYQEQAMQTARIIAGFSLGKADVLRKAISKKKLQDLENMKSAFIRGARTNGYDQATAESLFALIEKFGGYGFNKSHAVAYGIVAYQLAYLKANFPLYFYGSLLDSVIGDENKTYQYIDECRRREIKVLYPDVNASTEHYENEAGAIRLPLSTIKGIGRDLANRMLEERIQKGVYQDFFDATARILLVGANRKILVSLIDSGAMDCFHENRNTLKGSLDDAIRYADIIKVEKNGQIELDLNLVSKPMMLRLADHESEKSENEKEALGFCLGPHPIIEFRRKLNLHYPPLLTLKNEPGMRDGFAIIQNVHQHRTRKGDMMAFVKVIDETGELDLAVMPRLYSSISMQLIKGKYCIFHGKIQEDGSCLADRIQFPLK